MRIISGSARGRKLETFSGREIRPTADRVREAIFSSLQSRLGTFAGKSVLDLFAGTGAMALEALSRGAGRAVLIDRGPQAARLIPANVRACRFEGRALFLRSGVLESLPRLAPETFDLIFIDPPYGQGLALAAVEAVSRLELLAAEGLLCAETARDDDLPEAVGRLRREALRRYGSTAVHFFTHSDLEA